MAMVWGKASYQDIMMMPVERARRFLEWKRKYDEQYNSAEEDFINGL